MRFPLALEAISRSLDFSSRFPALLAVARSVLALLDVRMVRVEVRGSSMTRIVMAFVAHNRCEPEGSPIPIEPKEISFRKGNPSGSNRKR